MKTLKCFSFVTIIAAGFFAASAHNAAAQVSVSIGAPVCPYGTRFLIGDSISRY
jgi:hypothetical protein